MINCPCLFLASLGCQQSLAYYGFQLQHLNLCLHCHVPFSLRVCLHIVFLSSYKNSRHIELEPTLMTRVRLFISAKILFPNKVTFTDTNIWVRTSTYLLYLWTVSFHFCCRLILLYENIFYSRIIIVSRSLSLTLVVDKSESIIQFRLDLLLHH